MIWDRNELLQQITAHPNLSSMYYKWTAHQQELFLNFCTGASGIKFLYDGFFKELMNPEYTPERLNEFLSLLLRTNVKIREILPNDSTRIMNESSLLIMDIVVQLDDGSLANVEVQKFVFIPLDIFRKNQQNKAISNKLDAWLLFFSSDDPIDIIRLAEEYPQFREIDESSVLPCRSLLSFNRFILQKPSV